MDDLRHVLALGRGNRREALHLEERGHFRGLRAALHRVDALVGGEDPDARLVVGGVEHFGVGRDLVGREDSGGVAVRDRDGLVGHAEDLEQVADLHALLRPGVEHGEVAALERKAAGGVLEVEEPLLLERALRVVRNDEAGRGGLQVAVQVARNRVAGAADVELVGALRGRLLLAVAQLAEPVVEVVAGVRGPLGGLDQLRGVRVGLVGARTERAEAVHGPFLLAGQADRVARVDQVRVDDVGVHLPDVGPAERILQMLVADVPQGVAVLDDVGDRRQGAQQKSRAKSSRTLHIAYNSLFGARQQAIFCATP